MNKLKSGDHVKVIGHLFTGMTGVIDSFWMPEFCPDFKIVEVKMDGRETVISFAVDELEVIRG